MAVTHTFTTEYGSQLICTKISRLRPESVKNSTKYFLALIFNWKEVVQGSSFSWSRGGLRSDDVRTTNEPYQTTSLNRSQSGCCGPYLSLISASTLTQTNCTKEENKPEFVSTELDETDVKTPLNRGKPWAWCPNIWHLISSSDSDVTCAVNSGLYFSLFYPAPRRGTKSPHPLDSSTSSSTHTEMSNCSVLEAGAAHNHLQLFSYKKHNPQALLPDLSHQQTYFSPCCKKSECFSETQINGCPGQTTLDWKVIFFPKCFFTALWLINTVYVQT